MNSHCSVGRAEITVFCPHSLCSHLVAEIWPAAGDIQQPFIKRSEGERPRQTHVDNYGCRGKSTHPVYQQISSLPKHLIIWGKMGRKKTPQNQKPGVYKTTSCHKKKTWNIALKMHRKCTYFKRFTEKEKENLKSMWYALDKI